MTQTRNPYFAQGARFFLKGLCGLLQAASDIGQHKIKKSFFSSSPNFQEELLVIREMAQKARLENEALKEELRHLKEELINKKTEK